ncbi:hypothetical protein D3C81_1931650 [compost metagenome]
MRSTMSFTASTYCVHLSRLRQSSSVILKRLNAVFSRSWKRSSWVCWSMAIQNFTSTTPASVSCSSKSLISL